MMGCLYRIDFPNGKSYVGITSKTAEERFKKHLKSSGSGDCCRLVRRAIERYGEGAATMTTLAVYDDWESLCVVEKRAIVAFNTRYPHGYNLTDGGAGAPGVVQSDETRRLISDSLKGNQRRRGARDSELTRSRKSEAHLGKPKSEAQKEKIRAANKAFWSSPEQRERRSATMREAWARRKAEKSEEQP